MPELDADFEISTNNLEAEYEINEGQHFDCSFEIYASGATFSNITGSPYDNEALASALNQKADTSTVETLSDSISTIETTINSYGDIVDYNATDFATSVQGALADSAIQPNDSISLLSNDVGYITSSDLSNYATLDDLSSKQDTISDLDEIRSDAQDGQTAYNTIQNYGDIVLYNANEFATSVQGALANTALQPNDNITELNNNAGYITSASLPTVNNSTVKFQKNGSDIETITLNQSGNSTVNYQIPTQASDINAVPTSRTVNSKALSANISLNSSDVGALADTTTINDLTTTAQQNALNSNITSSLTSQISTNQGDIADIKDVIPSVATSSNQLADKNFVNSSIATNTANFIGTFTSVADLEAYSGTLTNNDYAFVETTDSAGNTLYDRYKYTTATTPASWQFEYELNNSSFTSTQWSAINSGANTTNIGQIATNTNDISNINTTIGGYGDVVTYNTSDFATASQGAKADTALQSGDNVSELVNNAGYLISSDLTGYATETWVGNQGYITGINSTDVTNALGYTPYDASNPNGYTSNVGTVTSVNNVSPISGNVTISIPTVNNGTLTILQNNVSKGTFSANQSGNDTISLTDTTYSAFTGADSITAGASGLVPAPAAGDNTKFLCGDGTFKVPSSTGANVDLSNLSATGENHFQAPLVSGTNIKTINSTSLLGSGNINTSEIFIAEYGVTSFTDIETAYNAGKIIFCIYNTNNIYRFISLTQSYAVFSYVAQYYSYLITCDTSNQWLQSGGQIEKTSNKVTSISSSSTDTEYPSAKLLYDQLELKQNTSTAVTHTANTQVGDSSTPVYIASNGVATSTGLSIASTRFDGQWTWKYLDTSPSAKTVGSRTHSLTSYLPSDSSTYDYEIWVGIRCSYGSTASYFYVGTIASPSSNFTSSGNYCLYAPGTANSRANYCAGILPIKHTDRNLYSQIVTGAAGEVNIYLFGYRRIGTNT